MKKEEYIEKCIKNGIPGFDYSLLPRRSKKRNSQDNLSEAWNNLC